MNDTVSRAPRTSLVMACVLAAMTLLLGWQSLFDPMGRDQGIHAAIALGLEHGLLPYSDIYNIKPPLTTFTHWSALTLFGHDMAAIRKLDMVLVWLAAWALAVAVSRLSDQRGLGLIAGVAALLLYYAQDFWTKAQTDAWASFCVVWALLVLSGAWQSNEGSSRRALIAAAGALMGAAVLFKYTLATFGLLIFTPLLAHGAIRFLWSDLIFLCLGGLAALGGMVALLAGTGTLGDYIEIQRYVLNYIGYQDHDRTLWREAFQIVFESPTATVFAAIGLVVSLWAMVARRMTLIQALVLILLFSGWMSGAAQNKGFAYHFMPQLPGFALATALGLHAVWTRLTRSSALGGTLTVALVIAGLIAEAPGTDRAKAIGLIGQPDFRRAYWTATEMKGFDVQAMADFSADFAAKRVPEETVFLWGYETITYLLLDEPPRYRYPYAWPLVVSFHDGRYTADLMTRLRADPPVWFLVNKQDQTPHVTGHERDSAASLPLIAPLQTFVDTRYTRTSTTPLYDVYRLK